MRLSEMEKEVAVLIAHGYKDVEIAKQLFISRRRVGEIIFLIKKKWKISSRVEIGVLAYHFGWMCPLDPPSTDREMKR
ncbi:response regulator transcription factor [Paenibacillus apiarius]|uniref:Helix-turn-helix transcriptional regulator n=1 Tax=Paenibacillus apiarius TaxID=46240 RepID=A0ABT4DNG2_9BACL|nr:helix-turn-helix transcriptional regulator [Paenibacillus apiarius]MBN3524016.1 helix-turn-helix transcriptional regulator [Paenibacillus apiarius]MCY9515493.1 helix-turn-helix transcriptional regulator [Paenibacillus apiarius]MCY9518902.1 helix-turn-helix transcriptional regulator [Paenibacillus apiarius]MCY9552052.1 helix-turn-helix transcriptional regulator [Paenibacillus apiarius]MCY9557272.1 helix-turn-helix transcriptional regulator [Paenibacillus apiarius]